MKGFVAFFFVLFSGIANAQPDPNQLVAPIWAEGKLLYKSEMASWYGTDLFLERYKAQANIGGYLSYSFADSAICIFFSKEDIPKVIGTIKFDSTYNVKTADLDLTERSLNRMERELYLIRKNALAEVNSDTLFKTYKNTNLNLIPLINGKEKKVYILTGPQTSGVVVFGNDYLLTYDEDNRLVGKKALHRNIIPINYGGKDQAESSMHSHRPETGDLITATDICTLLLYGKFTKWKTHNVVSEKYLSIWDCTKNDLFVMTMEAIKRISEDQEKRRKGN